MRLASLKAAAALAAVAATSTTAYAAQDSKAAYDRDLSCAAYHLEIAGFYKSERGQTQPRSTQLEAQYRASGTAKLSDALVHAEALGKELAEVKTDLFGLLETRITSKVTAETDPAFVLAHVKDTTLKADTCQRSGN